MSEEIEFNRLTENDDNNDRNDTDGQTSSKGRTEDMSDLRLLQELTAKTNID